MLYLVYQQHSLRAFVALCVVSTQVQERSVQQLFCDMYRCQIVQSHPSTVFMVMALVIRSVRKKIDPALLEGVHGVTKNHCIGFIDGYSDHGAM
jgi:hypothetical protein